MDEFDARMRTLMRAPRLDVDRVLQGSLRTTRTMLSDRGCAWVDACDPSRLRAAMLAGEPVVVAGPAPQTRVFFHVEDRISIRAIRTVMDDEEEEADAAIATDEEEDEGGGEADDEAPRMGARRRRRRARGADKTIFVSIEGPTAFAKKEAVATWGTGVQFFRFLELMVNVTEHALVPKHQLWTGGEVPGVQRDEDVERLPSMLTTDPVAQYYDYQVGDVVRITRKAGGMEEFHYFRRVVIAA